MRSLLTFFILLSHAALGFEVPSSCKQLLVGRAKDWNSSHVTLTLYQKNGRAWQPTMQPWQGRLGKSGLVWGLGLHPVPKGVAIKREGDMRTPAGLFRIGGAWGYAAQIQRHPSLPYRRVTSRDLWVEDPASSSYNRHIILDREPTTAWEKKQQMKQNDQAHSLKLFIAHNAPPQVRPGAGSSIFFHIWRNAGASPTAGCTTMSAAQLSTLVAKINPTLQPCYVILPEAEFQKLRDPWKLP